MRVLITRPAAQATEWVRMLNASGVDAVTLPLIAIAPPADALAVHQAWHDLSGQQLLVFVSPSAAYSFFALRPESAHWPSAVCVASPGPGSSQTLQRLGVPRSQIIEPAADAEQFDSQALWAQLAHHNWKDANVLIVRGAKGRDWLGTTLREQGANVALLTAYDRVVPDLDVAQQALLRIALDDHAEHLWLFSSSEAVNNLISLAGTTTDWSRTRAVVTHPRIAKRAHYFGLREVYQTRPTLSAVRACIQSIAP